MAQIILCSYTNGSDNGGSFETDWVCPCCGSVTVFTMAWNHEWVACDACDFQFNGHKIKGLDRHFDDYNTLNIGVKKHANYAYYKYLEKTGIIVPLSDAIYAKYARVIDAIGAPFGLDVGVSCFFT